MRPVMRPVMRPAMRPEMRPAMHPVIRPVMRPPRPADPAPATVARARPTPVIARLDRAIQRPSRHAAGPNAPIRPEHDAGPRDRAGA